MFQAMRSPHLQAQVGSRASVSTDYSETSSFISSAQSTTSSVVGEFSVLCLHDYEPTDPDQLGFRKGDILAILKTEDTGWWAAALGNTIGWVPRGYVEPISDAMADTLKTVRRDLRASAELWDSPFRGSASSLRSSFAFGSPDMSVIGDNESWDQRSVSLAHDTGASDYSRSSPGRFQPGPGPGSSSRSSFRSIYQSTPSTLPYSQDGYVSEATVHSHSSSVTPPGSHIHSSSTSSLPQSRSPVIISTSDPRLSQVLLSNPSASPPQPIPSLADIPASPKRGLLSPGRKSNKNKSLPSADDDHQAYQNAKSALAALPSYLKPQYGDLHIRIDYDGTVKSGTLEALVERLTVDPLKRSHEQQFRNTFLMTYKSFTDGQTLFDLLTDCYNVTLPPGLDEDQFNEWREKRLRPTQTRVLSTLQAWVEQYRLVKDEPHLVGKLMEFLKLVQSPPKNQLTAKLLLQTIEKQLAPSAISPILPSSIALSKSKGSKKSKPHKNDILKIDALELAQHLTLIEWRLYSKIRPSECIAWSKTQSGSEVENLLRFCGTSDKLAAWAKYSILSTANLGRRADIIEHWIKVAEKCRHLNNISSMSALVAALASTTIVRLQLTWAHVGRASHMEPLTKMTDPRGNFTAYRTFYGSVDTSCVPFIGIYLTNLVHIADQYKETTHVTYSTTTGLPASPMTPNSPYAFAPSSPYNQPTPSQHTHQRTHHHHNSSSSTTTATIQHINFIRLQKSAEVIHHMLRHQTRPYIQSNPPQSSGAPIHPLPASHPHTATAVSLGAENAGVMSYVETMLSTGGLGNTPPPDVPLGTPGPGLASAHVGAVESWYWQKSAELQASEIESSDIRRGLEAAGF